MKHYLSYESDGSISGINPYTAVGTGLFGWPDEYEIDNPDTEHAPSKFWRDCVKQQPTGGYIRYDCPCPRTARNCNCASAARMTKYVEDGRLVDTLPVSVLIDGAEVTTTGQVISKPVGARIKVEVKIPGAPNGERIAVMQGAMPQLLDTTEPMLELTTADGELEEFDAYAPAQGLTGHLRIFGRVCALLEVRIRGWGS